MNDLSAQIDQQLDAAKAKATELRTSHDRLLEALKDLLAVVAIDELLPESVSYMKQAREAVRLGETV